MNIFRYLEVIRNKLVDKECTLETTLIFIHKTVGPHYLGSKRETETDISISLHISPQSNQINKFNSLKLCDKHVYVIYSMC